MWSDIAVGYMIYVMGELALGGIAVACALVLFALETIIEKVRGVLFALETIIEKVRGPRWHRRRG